MKRLAIYSYHMYEWFGKNAGKATGGAEFQLLTLASRLRDKGLAVIFLVGDGNYGDYETKEGFDFVKIFSGKNKNPFSKLTYLFNGLERSAADVIIERGSSPATFWLSLYARIRRKKFVFSGASDVNFMKDAIDPSLSGTTAGILYRRGITLSASIIVQKQSQLELLRKHFGRQGIVVPSFAAPVGSHGHKRKTHDVVWANNIIPYKQPESVLELAALLPNVRFLMIGGSRDESYYERIRTLAEKLKNVDFRGFVPFHKVDQLIVTSKILINTTRVSGKYEEGFPNSFLQAWQLKVPVVSLISNPDHILDRFEIGRCSGSVSKMKADIEELLGNATLRKRMGKQGEEYVRRYHDSREIEEQYVKVLFG